MIFEPFACGLVASPATIFSARAVVHPEHGPAGAGARLRRAWEMFEDTFAPFGLQEAWEPFTSEDWACH
ncbi:hypothetical protein ACH5A3_26225 [Streptomyces echinatus]|uniref:hypothetical protein n=1 Tax=Streptomyces echinatus TaxID=67293 RepID=UPI00379516FA